MPKKRAKAALSAPNASPPKLPHSRHHHHQHTHTNTHKGTMFGRKKFVPPLLKKPASAVTPGTDGQPVAKRAKIEPLSGGRSLKLGGPIKRKPLLLVRNLEPGLATAAGEEKGEGGMAEEAYFRVLWRKPTTKKHKTFDGDGVLAISGGYAVLQDTSGKEYVAYLCIHLAWYGVG